MLRPWVAGLVLLGACGGSLAWWRAPGSATEISASLTAAELPADGFSSALLTIETEAKPQIESSHRVHVGPISRSGVRWQARLRAGVDPGTAKIRIRAAGAETVAALELRAFEVDREPNGMPDALQLDSPQDQAAFREWFAFLAEAQFFQRDGERPAEINDCAALIRYAYRESLKAHDAGWARQVQVPLVRAMPSVEKYSYPHTLLGPSLFRVRNGDARSAFSQFADAQTLQRWNTHFVSRDIARAQRGDLLFYRHESADLPFHGMIYLGQSLVETDGAEPFVVYHTGPDGADPGEIRRPAISELLRHPNPQWRPLAGNRTFLGVYRWNILP